MAKITNLKDVLVRNDPRGNYELTEFHKMRYDYDGYKWWNTGTWTCSPSEMSNVLSFPGNALILECCDIDKRFRKTFGSLNEMTKWCRENAVPTYGDTICDDEFDAYIDGDKCVFWLHMITRKGDYNLYLHCYSKEAI